MLDYNPHHHKYFACGKAIITGEHAVIYGAKAVGMPLKGLGITMKASICEKDGSHEEFLINDKKVPEILNSIIKDCYTVLGLEPQKICIRGHSSLLLGAGIGSSAALNVSLVKTIADLHNKKLTTAEIATFANQLEKKFHGNPSGLDTHIISYNQPVSYIKGEEPKPLSIVPPEDENKTPTLWPFLLIDSKTRASTKDLVEKAKPYFTSEDGSLHIQQFNETSEQAIEALLDGNVKKLARAMNNAGHLLYKAGVVTKELASIIEDSKKLGALAAKSTGAGGGGCVLALLDPMHYKNQIIKISEHFSSENIYEVFLP